MQKRHWNSEKQRVYLSSKSRALDLDSHKISKLMCPRPFLIISLVLLWHREITGHLLSLRASSKARSRWTSSEIRAGDRVNIVEWLYTSAELSSHSTEGTASLLFHAAPWFILIFPKTWSKSHGWKVELFPPATRWSHQSGLGWTWPHRSHQEFVCWTFGENNSFILPS